MFYREGLLAPHPTPRLEDHPLSAVHDCLFNLFAATLHKGDRSLISTNFLILFGITKYCLSSGWIRSLYLFIRRAIKQIVIIIVAYHFCLQYKKLYPTSCCHLQLHMQRTLLGIIYVDLDVTSPLLIIYSAFIKNLRKTRNTMKQCITY